ncbi:MAG: hypothetical protein GXO10_00700 [Crenarchaeota archaeon]|nr:hypothetical protein [Thermoproteota archaeon]
MRTVFVAGLGVAGSSLLYLIRSVNLENTQVVACDPRFYPWSHIVCGELVPEVSYLRSKVPNLVYEYLARSHKVLMENTRVVRSFNSMTIIIGDLRLKINFKFYMIDKSLLIRKLIEKSEDFCELMLGYSAYRYEVHKNHVRVYLRSREGHSKVIDADVVAASDSFPSVFYSPEILYILSEHGYKYLICVSCVAEMNQYFEEPLIIIDPEICPGGYGWIFPKSASTANVGIGVLIDYVINIEKVFEKFLKKFNLKKLSRPLSKTLPVDGIILSRVSNIVYLGDAGGFVVPTNGAGINPAIASSLIALEAQLNTELFNYKVRKIFGEYFSKLVKIRRIIDKYLTDIELFKNLVREINRNRILIPFFKKVLSDLMLGHVVPIHRVVISCIDSLVTSLKFPRL